MNARIPTLADRLRRRATGLVRRARCYADVGQVSDLFIRKRWREVEGRPRVTVSVRPIPQEPPC